MSLGSSTGACSCTFALKLLLCGLRAKQGQKNKRTTNHYLFSIPRRFAKVLNYLYSLKEHKNKGVRAPFSLLPRTRVPGPLLTRHSYLTLACSQLATLNSALNSPPSIAPVAF